MRICNTCGAKFEPIQGNFEYYHVCAYEIIQSNVKEDFYDEALGQTVKRPIPSLAKFVRRKDYRNENKILEPNPINEKKPPKHIIKSEGKGYTEL